MFLRVRRNEVVGFYCFSYIVFCELVGCISLLCALLALMASRLLPFYLVCGFLFQLFYHKSLIYIDLKFENQDFFTMAVGTVAFGWRCGKESRTW